MLQTHSNSNRGLATGPWVCVLIVLLLGSRFAPAQSTDNFQSKIAPDLLELGRTGIPIYVVIQLQKQPYAPILRRMDQQSSFRLLSTESRPAGISTKPVRSPLHREWSEAQREIEAARVELRNQAYAKIKPAIKPYQDRLEARLIGLGAARIQRYRILNMLAAEIPTFARSILPGNRMSRASRK